MNNICPNKLLIIFVINISIYKQKSVEYTFL